MAKTQRAIEAGRENAARKRRGGAASRQPPAVVDWDRAWANVHRMFADLYGDETAEKSQEVGL
jgi:hypothetical protein